MCPWVPVMCRSLGIHHYCSAAGRLLHRMWHIHKEKPSGIHFEGACSGFERGWCRTGWGTVSKTMNWRLGRIQVEIYCQGENGERAGMVKDLVQYTTSSKTLLISRHLRFRTLLTYEMPCDIFVELQLLFWNECFPQTKLHGCVRLT